MQSLRFLSCQLRLSTRPHSFARHMHHLPGIHLIIPNHQQPSPVRESPSPIAKDLTEFLHGLRPHPSTSLITTSDFTTHPELVPASVGVPCILDYNYPLFKHVAHGQLSKSVLVHQKPERPFNFNKDTFLLLVRQRRRKSVLLSNVVEIQLTSVLRKRRIKMNKHKLRKLRKRTRSQRK